MPQIVSAWVAANWFVVETLFTLMITYFLRWITGRIWWSMAFKASRTIWRRTSPLTMATVDFEAASGVKMSGGVFGPATCARSAVKPPTPATAEKKLLREKFITCLQNAITDYQTLL